MVRQTKKDQFERTLEKIKNKTNKKNIDLVLPLIKWVDKKIDLIVKADTFKQDAKKAKREGKRRPRPLQIARGEIWQCELGYNIGSEQNESRPVLIIQNDVNNANSPNTIIVPLTGLEHRNNEKGPSEEEIQKIRDKLRETEVLLLPEEIKDGEQTKLAKPSILYCQNIREINKERLQYRITHIHSDRWDEINAAIKHSLGI